MWYPPTVTVAAANEPVTEAEARAHARVATGEMTTEIPIYIASARAYVEAYIGGPIVSRTVTVKCDSFDDCAHFPIVPLSSVSGITYIDANGTTQTLSTDVYEVRSDGLEASIALKFGQVWPVIREGSRITVTAVTGNATVPADIKHAVLLLVGQAVDMREPVKIEGASTVDWLLVNHRVYG